MKPFHSQKPAAITKLAFALVFILATCSCSKEDACESNNTGTLTFVNSNRNGTLQVFINNFGTIAVNGPGDVSVPPGESVSVDLPAGPQNLKARLSFSSCSGNRCSVSTSGLPERDVDLSACERSNVSY